MCYYLNLVEAAEILNESKVLTRIQIKKGNLSAYAMTPQYFQQSNFRINKDEEIFEPFRPLLSEMFDEPLAKYCQLLAPEWNDGNIVTCQAIKVSGQSGNIPTVKADTDIKSVGRIDHDGKICLNTGWKFNENELFLDENEVRLLKSNIEPAKADRAKGLEEALQQDAETNNEAGSTAPEVKKDIDHNQYVNESRNKRKCDAEMAYNLNIRYNLSTWAIHEILQLDKKHGNANVTNNAKTQRVRRLFLKWEKTLAASENVTSDNNCHKK